MALQPGRLSTRPAIAWYVRHDPQLASLRRGLRAAVVVSFVFSIAHVVVGNLVLGLYATFGSVALLLFADIGGPKRQRLGAYAVLAVAGLGLLTLGTICSSAVWLAVVSTLLVSALVLFVGVVSSVVAGVAPALLLSFVLGVAVPGGTATLPSRIDGWLLAAGASMIALTVLWPLPSRNPLRELAAAGCLVLAARVDDPGVYDESDPLAALRTRLYATPVRPGAVGTAGRHLLHLVDGLIWLETLLPSASHEHVAAESLRCSAAALRGDRPTWPDQPPRTPIEFTAEAIASEAELVAGADRRGVLQRLLGDDGAGEELGWQVAATRLRAQLTARSVWLRTSTRGAVALAASVLVAQETGVQHGFWVTFGALAVLRTTAVATGQNVLRALLGTVVGTVVGSAVIAVAGRHPPVLWTVLPIAVVVTGVAPVVSGFIAGQAAFTVTILVVFAFIGPTRGIGVVRVEDVALGCAVSLVAGLLLWPRGSARALRLALAEALDAASDELSARLYGREPTPSDAARERLDGAFRQLLAEQGTKPGTLAELSEVVSAPSALALTSRSLDGHPPPAAAQAEGAELAGWFHAAATAMDGGAVPPAPLAYQGDPALTGLRLLAARTRPALVALARQR